MGWASREVLVVQHDSPAGLAAGEGPVGVLHGCEWVGCGDGDGEDRRKLATPPEDRDPGLAESMRDAVLGQIITDLPAPAPADSDTTVTDRSPRSPPSH
jgi:hypothetical protein